MCSDPLIHVDDPNHAANLIPSLCAEFYKLGWVTGTGGGISIRQPRRIAGDDHNDDGSGAFNSKDDLMEDLIYIAPSGVQKERIRSEDLFVMRVKKVAKTKEEMAVKCTNRLAGRCPVKAEIDYVRRPDGLKPSACTPLFLAAFERRGATACIHTHSQWAVLVTLLVERDMHVLSDHTRPLDPASRPPPPVIHPDQINLSAKRWDSIPGPAAVLKRPFQIGKLEQIKGIPCAQFETTWADGPTTGTSGRKLPHHSFYSTLTVPVIENTAHEEDLAASLTAAMDRYPDACAVLVLRHGVYVWGETWAAAKTRAESLDYIFRLAVEMHRDGFSWV